MAAASGSAPEVLAPKALAPGLAPEALAPAAAAGLPLTLEEQDAKSGIYHAGKNMKIVCFGDPEGNSLKKILQPKDANQESQTNVLTPAVSNLTELYQYLTFDEKNNLVLEKDVILVCLGDVIGDGPDNIELARTLLKLKRDNSTRVILITGNRDVNKIRLGWELEPTDACMAELTGRVKAFVGRESGAFVGFEFAFKRNDPADFDYMFSDYPTSIASKRGCLERVTHVLTSSMGEKCGWRFLVDEYLTKNNFTPEEVKSSSISDEVKSYIYVYLVQAMSGAITCEDAPEFNNIFEELLMAGHLMASIETPDRGKFGLMHSLPPRMLIPTNPGRIYKEQFDKTVKEASDIIDEVIKSSKKVELNVGLVGFNSYVTKLLSDAKTTKSPADMKLLLEFVSGITSGNFYIYQGKNSFSGLDLPVSNQTFNKDGFDLLAKTAEIQVGGKSTDLILVSAVTHIDMKDFSRIICSHKPQGYIGAKLEFGNQLYYCVDVSKIDDQEYHVKHRYGCCFLVIVLSELNVKDDAFIGRIMMKKTQFPNGHKVFSDDSENKDSAFDNDGVLYVNYVKTDMTPSKSSEFIPKPPPGNFPHILNMTYLGKPYKFEFENGENYTKKPTLTYEKSPTEMMNTLGGSRTRTRTRTRKRRSRYLKKSARTTRKRRRISKKLAQKNNKRKNKKSKRSSTSR